MGGAGRYEDEEGNQKSRVSNALMGALGGAGLGAVGGAALKSMYPAQQAPAQQPQAQQPQAQQAQAQQPPVQPPQDQQPPVQQPPVQPPQAQQPPVQQASNEVSLDPTEEWVRSYEQMDAQRNFYQNAIQQNPAIEQVLPPLDPDNPNQGFGNPSQAAQNATGLPPGLNPSQGLFGLIPTDWFEAAMLAIDPDLNAFWQQARQGGQGMSSLPASFFANPRVKQALGLFE